MGIFEPHGRYGRGDGKIFVSTILARLWRADEYLCKNENRGVFDLAVNSFCEYSVERGGYGEMVSYELPKLKARVRFPLPAPEL